MPKKPLTRAFKTGWFSKAARKVLIGDPALVAAIREVMQGRLTISAEVCSRSG